MTDSSGQCGADWLSQRLAPPDGDPAGGEGVPDAAAAAVIDGWPILVDCRPASDYGAVHIDGAVSLALPTLIQRRLLKGNLAMPAALGYCSSNDRGSTISEDQWKSRLIVLYDDDMTLTSQGVTASEDVTNGNTTSKLVSVLLTQLKKEGYSVCLLSGGIVQFKAKYPHLCTARDPADQDNSQLQTGFRNLKLSATAASEDRSDESMTPPVAGEAVPVEVLPHLFLGDAKNASDQECLEGKGIKYILNVTPNVPNKFERNEDYKYLQIPINDHWSQNLTNYFPQAITFIDEGLRLNHGVLVHCLAGISRSVTVTVAYIMYSMSLSLDDAYDYVKRRKPNVSPNLTFMGQLLDFENALKDDRKQCLCACHSSPSSSSSSAFSNSSSPPHPHPPSPSSPLSSCSSCSCSASSSSSCCLVSPSDIETGNCRQEVDSSSGACALPSTTTPPLIDCSNQSAVYCNR